MSRCVRLRCTTAAVILLAVLSLASCEFPGFLGESYELNETLYWESNDVRETYGGKDGVLTLAMSVGASPVTVFTGSVIDAIASANLATPTPAVVLPWSDIMPLTPTLTDVAARGCVINTMSLDADGQVDPVSFRNLAATKFVFPIYSDRDVGMTASGGPISAPGGVQANMSMDIELKKGWNLIILTRTGSAEPYTDTYSVGDMPDDVYLFWEGRGT